MYKLLKDLLKYYIIKTNYLGIIKSLAQKANSEHHTLIGKDESSKIRSKARMPTFAVSI